MESLRNHWAFISLMISGLLFIMALIITAVTKSPLIIKTIPIIGMIGLFFSLCWGYQSWKLARAKNNKENVVDE
jgi:hypothetical protein